MRVGLVCGYLDPMRDGVADYTRRLVVHLRATGLEPLVLTSFACAEAAGSGAVGVTRRWDVRGVAAAARVCRRLDLDLLHVQYAPSVFGSSRAVGLLPLLLPRQVPLVMTLHEYGVWPGPGRRRPVRSTLWAAAERSGRLDRETLLLTSRSARLLVTSPEHRDVLLARFPNSPPAAVDVPVGLNVEVVARDGARCRAEVRRELGAASEAPLVAFFGFLHPEKSLDRLIAALAALRARRPDIRLLIIGGAESHSVPSAAARQLRQELDQVAAACGVQEHVHFTGYLPDAQVSRLLQAADAVALPLNAGVTRKSGSLLAAFAAGVPVVATAPPGEVGGPTEIDGVLRIPPRDTAALTDALGQVLDDGALADRLTTAGRALAASQSWEVIAAQHAEVYGRVLAARRDGSSWTRPAEPNRVGRSTSAEGNRDVTA
ncbi:MAG: glycosyltransferase [Actinomycetota bacterium]|nr:glycosyltransferase [Actinomycetota bacterium]